MHISLVAERINSLPRLAWVARFNPSTGVVRVLHGSSVEAQPEFLVEGVWDAPFADGQFHRAEHFFGSGVRAEGSQLWVVPSRALVDRVLYCYQDGEFIASNSFALLLGATGARLDPDHDYRESSFTILNGIERYEPRIPVIHPSIEAFHQLYHNPLVVTRDGAKRASIGEPTAISSFEDYTSLLTSALGRLRENFTSPGRQTPIDAFSTISAGYDSAAVTALVREMIGASFTSRRSNSAIPAWLSRNAAIDDGTPIAHTLGVQTIYLGQSHGGISEDELYFLAPTAADPELIFHSMARHIEHSSAAAVVFTGFHGDKVWDVATAGTYLSDEMLRGDTSGLNLSEIRLKAGFINVPVTFMYARSIRDLVAISRSDELRPWRLFNGYDRPIPRRILEGAGVPRLAFGQRKKAVIQKYTWPVHPRLKGLFLAHIRKRHGLTYGRLLVREAANRAAFLLMALKERAARLLGAPPRDVATVYFGRRVDLPYELHVWALQVLAQELADTLPAEAGSVESSIESHSHAGAADSNTVVPE